MSGAPTLDNSKPADEKPLVAVYRKTKRGVVCKTLEQVPDFKVPPGWFDTPYAVGWDDTQPGIIPANVHDEPTEDELKPKTGKQQGTTKLGDTTKPGDTTKLED